MQMRRRRRRRHILGGGENLKSNNNKEDNYVYSESWGNYYCSEGLFSFISA